MIDRHYTILNNGLANIHTNRIPHKQVYPTKLTHDQAQLKWTYKF